MNEWMRKKKDLYFNFLKIFTEVPSHCLSSFERALPLKFDLLIESVRVNFPFSFPFQKRTT